MAFKFKISGRNRRKFERWVGTLNCTEIKQTVNKLCAKKCTRQPVSLPQIKIFSVEAYYQIKIHALDLARDKKKTTVLNTNLESLSIPHMLIAEL